MAESLDPACCLLSRAEWKRMLMQHIAIAVQRGNADIMIQASQRSREALLGRPARTRRPKRSQPIGSDRSPHAASVVSAGLLSPLRATECGAAASVSDVCQPAETPVPARVIATAVDTAVSTPVVGGAGCAVRADSSASFIALRDVSNSVGSDAVTVMLEWCVSPCVSISRTDCGNMGDIVLDNAAAPAAPLLPSLCESDFESVSVVSCCIVKVHALRNGDRKLGILSTGNKGHVTLKTQHAVHRLYHKQSPSHPFLPTSILTPRLHHCRTRPHHGR
jgi:hypothetical protein